MTKPAKTQKRTARTARLSAALRENLKRRKAQARARDAGQDDAPAAEETQRVSGDASGSPEAPDFRRNRSPD